VLGVRERVDHDDGDVVAVILLLPRELTQRRRRRARRAPPRTPLALLHRRRVPQPVAREHDPEPGLFVRDDDASHLRLGDDPAAALPVAIADGATHR
jgi:hypothetical protein